MTVRLRSLIGLALGLACATVGAEELVVFQRATADGSIELTNIPADDGQYRSVATAPAPSPSARGVPGAAGAVGSAYPPSAPGTPIPASEEPRAAATTAAPPAAPAATSTTSSADFGAPPESPLPVRGSMGQRLRALYEGARAARAAQLANGQSGW